MRLDPWKDGSGRLPNKNRMVGGRLAYPSPHFLFPVFTVFTRKRPPARRSFRLEVGPSSVLLSRSCGTQWRVAPGVPGQAQVPQQRPQKQYHQTTSGRAMKATRPTVPRTLHLPGPTKLSAETVAVVQQHHKTRNRSRRHAARASHLPAAMYPVLIALHCESAGTRSLNRSQKLIQFWRVRTQLVPHFNQSSQWAKDRPQARVVEVLMGKPALTTHARREMPMPPPSKRWVASAASFSLWVRNRAVCPGSAPLPRDSAGRSACRGSVKRR